jgi:Flp pilus assembly protein TadD
MKRSGRFANSLSVLAVAAVLSGCATGQQSRESIFGNQVDRANIGLATKAQAALAQQDYATAVSLAEQAVENTPNDAGFRALLGNCYFASGRFASAEQAYRDSLSLLPGQAALVLKLALVEIAQGKSGEAMAVLDGARGTLDPADYGLAVALAGQPDAAVDILNQAARTTDADGRVRQNLALAYALSGDWTMARTIAAQDVPPEQLDVRIQQWMKMATPTRPSDQVAALTGVTPRADPGQPQRLALNSVPAHPERYAAVVAPAPQATAPVPAPQPEAVEMAIPSTPPPALPEPMLDEAAADRDPVAPAEVPAPVVAAAVQTLIAPLPEQPKAEAVSVPVASPAPAEAVPAPVVAPAPVEAPFTPAIAPLEMTAPPLTTPVETAASVQLAAAPVAPAKPVIERSTRFDAPVHQASFVTVSDEVRREAAKLRRPAGKSKAVVQLGAYSSPAGVATAWQHLSRRFPALAAYTPMRARFDSPKGTFWRLSIKGFASDSEARDRCELLQSRGGKCFVRKSAGDAPIQYASR